ncbi:MAG TPA: NUDIX domain-containing protein [Bacillota bacterium]
MNYEKSCGAVVYRQSGDRVEYLLLKHKNGNHWGFPKGHVESEESETETALRETYEEAGLRINLKEGFRYQVEYAPKENTWKEVIYFIGEAQDDKVTCQLEEITGHCWADYETALDLLCFENSKQLLRQAHQFLRGSSL